MKKGNDMQRLTVDKDTKDMDTTELAHNCCYIRAGDGEAMYRDYDKEISARELLRNIMVKNGLWEDNKDSTPLDQELFVCNLLQYGEEDQRGLIALFYRNLWAMAELRDKLKEYEDTGLYPEQIKMLHSMYLKSLKDIKRTEDYYRRHRQQCGKWDHGEPQRCWTDENNNFCIKYYDGSWWRYKETDGDLEWWQGRRDDHAETGTDV